MCPHHLRCIANPAPHDIHRNVNQLVSIAAYKIGTKTISNYENRGFTPTPGFKPENGIDGDNKILNGILEATASLAVADARKQVVAVALHVGKTTLTIAENCQVAAGLAEHIGELWGMLREIAPGSPTKHQKLEFFKSAYCYSVSKNLKRYDSWVPRLSLFLSALPTASGIPELDQFITKLEEFVEVLKDTHDFLQKMETEKIRVRGLENLKHSLNDRDHLIEYSSQEEWESLMPRIDHVAKGYRSVLDDFETYYPTKEYHHRNIYDSAKKVYPALDWVKALTKLDDEFNAKIAQLEPQKLDLQKLNDQKLDLQNWVKTVNADPDPGLLRHAFEKLTTQHRHIKILIEAPEKLFFTPLFIAPMDVISVPKTEEVSITLPMDELGLSRLIRAMYESVKPWITTNLITLEVDKLLPELKKVVNGVVNSLVNGVVHCECALVAYLEDPKYQDEKNSNYTDVSNQYNYIGVSKPSCGACNAWLIAFNNTHSKGRTWYTSGSHGKWYNPWAIPPAFDFADLKDKMAKIVCEEFVRYCNPRVYGKTHDFTGSVNL